MTHDASRKTTSSAPLHSAGCPRCGFRQIESFKYCPNCAYRLVPAIVPVAPEAPEAPPRGQRLVAVGGFFALISLILLVVLAGVRIFIEGELSSADVQRSVAIPRDAGAIPLNAASLVEVPSGRALFGAYGPAPRDEEAELRREAALRSALDALAASQVQRVLDAVDVPVLPVEARTAMKAVAASRVAEGRAAVEEAVRPAEKRYLDIESRIVDDPFAMGKYEVTNDQYYGFLLARAARSGLPTPEPLYPRSWTRSTGRDDVERIYDNRRGNHPVRAIPYDAAIEFCAWFWEEELRSDPDKIVDLPTDIEFVLAARGDRASYNFPWGRDLGDPGGRAVLAGEPRPVSDEQVGQYEEFGGLVGNVAEWVHGARAAGWSYKKSEVLRSWYLDPSEPRTPFSHDEIPVVAGGAAREDVGFRIVVRYAPALPAFEPVPAGPVRLGETENRFFLWTFDEDPERITFASLRAEVATDFGIARTETTNRQYLAFLVDVAAKGTGAKYLAFVMEDAAARAATDLEKLKPKTWDRRHPHWTDLVPEVYAGPWGDPAQIPYVYAAGSENHPVQGVSIEQAEAYAAWLSARLGAPCRIPTVAEYLRAGRGDGTRPYPWGDDRLNQALICARPTQDEQRPVSLLGRLGPDRHMVVGLVGNLPEYVRDTEKGRLLLAGGGYPFPPGLCTLESFFDAEWDYVEWVDEQGYPGDFSNLPYFHGFRVVREAGSR